MCAFYLLAHVCDDGSALIVVVRLSACMNISIGTFMRNVYVVSCMYICRGK